MSRAALIICMASILSVFAVRQLSAQYIYMSTNSWVCSTDGVDAWMSITTYRIYLLAPQVDDATGASFRIESEAYGPEDFVSVTPSEGVIIESGDLLSGVVLSFPSGLYNGDALLTIDIELNEPHSYFVWNVAWTRDVELYSMSQGTLQLDDAVFYTTHCYQSGAWIEWFHDDTVDAVVGEPATIPVPGLGHSIGGLTGTNFDVQDLFDWVTGCSACGMGAVCGACPWHVDTVWVHISVPDTTSDGLINQVTLVPTGPCCNGTTFYIRAIDKVAVRERTWGAVKALFKNN